MGMLLKSVGNDVGDADRKCWHQDVNDAVRLARYYGGVAGAGGKKLLEMLLDWHCDAVGDAVGDLLL